jgi:hypothetical protein
MSSILRTTEEEVTKGHVIVGGATRCVDHRGNVAVSTKAWSVDRPQPTDLLTIVLQVAAVKSSASRTSAWGSEGMQEAIEVPSYNSVDQCIGSEALRWCDDFCVRKAEAFRR